MPEDSETLEGGCLCGFVRYRVGGIPAQETCCHCSSCRRASGAPYVAWFTLSAEAFALLSGEPSRYRSSPHVTRSFCPRCGTPLAYQRDDLPGEIDLTTASLDHPERVPPRDHTWVSEKLSWVDRVERLPGFPAARDQSSASS